MPLNFWIFIQDEVEVYPCLIDMLEHKKEDEF